MVRKDIDVFLFEQQVLNSVEKDISTAVFLFVITLRNDRLETRKRSTANYFKWQFSVLAPLLCSWNAARQYKTGKRSLILFWEIYESWLFSALCLNELVSNKINLS